jgi:hypothetical protein
VEVEAAGSQGRLPKVWEGIAFKKSVMTMIMKQEKGHAYSNNINKALLYHSMGGWRRQTEAESCSKPSQINSLLFLLDLLKHGG